MSVKALREYHGKAMLSRHLGGNYEGVLINVSSSTEWVNPCSQLWTNLLEANPWLATKPLVAKPDQLIKRRGKATRKETSFGEVV